jgi:hypothetical protein
MSRLRLDKAPERKRQPDTASSMEREHAPKPANLAQDLLALQRTAGNQAVTQVLQRAQHISPPGVPSNGLSMVNEVLRSPGQPLVAGTRAFMESAFGQGFSHVRIHTDTQAAALSAGLNARAFTIGQDIAFGVGEYQPGTLIGDALIAHELAHVIQQGGRLVAPQAKLEVSHPTDTAEIEADTLAESVISSAERPSTSRSLVLRDQLRVTPPTISRVMAPLIQRDLKGEYPARNGTFNLDLKRAKEKVPHQGRSFTRIGLEGTVKFKASEEARDSKSIRLLQIARNEDLTTNRDVEWKGEEATRNELRTVEEKDKDIKPGYLVDILPPDRQKQALPVSPYYRDYWKNEGKSQDGSKEGGKVEEASLWDFPRTFSQRRFSFETAAKATDQEFIYASISWGFTVSGNWFWRGVKEEHASVHDEPSATFGAAINKLNEFYSEQPSKPRFF